VNHFGAAFYAPRRDTENANETQHFCLIVNFLSPIVLLCCSPVAAKRPGVANSTMTHALIRPQEKEKKKKKEPKKKRNPKNPAFRALHKKLGQLNWTRCVKTLLPGLRSRGMAIARINWVMFGLGSLGK